MQLRGAPGGVHLLNICGAREASPALRLRVLGPPRTAGSWLGVPTVGPLCRHSQWLMSVRNTARMGVVHSGGSNRGAHSPEGDAPNTGSHPWLLPLPLPIWGLSFLPQSQAGVQSPKSRHPKIQSRDKQPERLASCPAGWGGASLWRWRGSRTVLQGPVVVTLTDSALLGDMPPTPQPEPNRALSLSVNVTHGGTGRWRRPGAGAPPLIAPRVLNKRMNPPPMPSRLQKSSLPQPSPQSKEFRRNLKRGEKWGESGFSISHCPHGLGRSPQRPGPHGR